MSFPRAPVEVLSGDGGDAAAGIEGDFAMLDRGVAATRTWRCRTLAVVLGASRDRAGEVCDEECARRGATVLRRASGGGTVVIGAGTLQYAFVLPHEPGLEPPTITAVQRACNAIVQVALGQAGAPAEVASDECGDLVVDGRKVGGLALRRRREATLLHGTLLVDADLDLVASLLKHPMREPVWRRRRSHREFLVNLGRFDERAFARLLEENVRAPASGAGAA